MPDALDPADQDCSHLPPGSEYPWPKTTPSKPDVALVEGEVVLIGVLRSTAGEILRRRSLVGFQAPCVLPTLPNLPNELDVRLKVVRTATIIPLLDDSVQAALYAAPPRVPVPDLLNQFVRLGTVVSDEPLAGEPRIIDVLLHWLAERYGTTVFPLAHPPDSQLDSLLALLERANLISVPLRLEPGDLQRDCGDLILLLDTGPLLLLSEQTGYWVRDPSMPHLQARRFRAADLSQHPAPWEGIGITPALSGQAASLAVLTHFSYGKATHRAVVFVTATTLGLAIGFLLAVGKAVGAAIWIVALGGMGVLLGLGLAILSNSLRPVLITALLSTLLGLLVPTFNTLLANQALPDKDISLMLQMAALLLAAALSDVGLRWYESRTLLGIQHLGAHRMQLATMNRLLHLPLSFFQQYRAGDLALRYGSIAQAQQEVQSILSGGALQAALSIVFLFFMLRISLQLTLLAVLLALVLVGPTVWIGRRTLRLEKIREDMVAEAGSRSLELINSVSKLRLAGVEKAAVHYWWGAYRDAISRGYEVHVRSALAGLLQTVVPSLGVLLLFIIISRLVADASVDPKQRVPNLGELLGFISAFSTFIGAVVSTSALMVQAFELPVLLGRARPIFEATPEGEDLNRLDPGLLRGAVELDEVWFRYNDDSPWVIHGIQLIIQPGEFVAVVGPSGSGKSTLVRLLLGLEHPHKGSIRLDGRPLDRLRLDLVRRQIGVVPQNAALLAGTIHEVIAGGAKITLKQAWQAAEQAAIATDIQSFPMGMHTFVAEGGGNLSGGQRQRLAIARALVRQPGLLILDEATSALDNIAQAEVSRNLRLLGLTRIVIAHRLSTIRHADRIIMIEAGQIVQEGDFNTLINEDGPFAEMMRGQRSATVEKSP